jgi:hypothetical protein
MARKLHIIAAREREARERRQRAAPVLRKYAGLKGVSVRLNFVDPEGREQPSPRGMVYSEDMHLFFDFPCPLRDCEKGGFNAGPDLLRAVAQGRHGHTGVLRCKGKRARSGVKGQCCDLELNYVLSLRTREAAAA